MIQLFHIFLLIKFFYRKYIVQFVLIIFAAYKNLLYWFIMSKLNELYQKALRSTASQKLPESINDLLIKDLNGLSLSNEENIALQNYYKFRNQLLATAKDDADFTQKIKQLRVIANFTNWKEFLNEH